MLMTFLSNSDLKNSFEYLSEGPYPGWPFVYNPYLEFPIYAKPPFATYMNFSPMGSSP